MHHYCRLAGNLSTLTGSQWPTESHTTVNCLYCSSLLHVDCVYELCECVCVCSHAHVIVFYPPSSSLTGFPGSGQETVGHRAGIKQRNNGEFPPLNLLMGSQWLPWLLPNYQPLDSLTSLHQPGCVWGV